MEEPLWLDRSIVEALHAAQIRDHGGQPGIRDEGCSIRPSHRPMNVCSHDDSVDLAGLAAEYGYGFVKNHALLDGNKRIGFVAANVFLLLNGFEIDAPEPEAVDVMIGVADGSINRDEFAVSIRSRIVPFTNSESIGSRGSRPTALGHNAIFDMLRASPASRQHDRSALLQRPPLSRSARQLQRSVRRRIR